MTIQYFFNISIYCFFDTTIGSRFFIELQPKKQHSTWHSETIYQRLIAQKLKYL